MVALVTQADVEDRLGRTFAAGPESARVARLIDDASANVRRYTGQTFTYVASETVRLRAAAGGTRLPQRPVVDVMAVENTDGDPLSFLWDGVGTIYLTAFSDLNIFDVEPIRGSWITIDVTYEHGFETMPDDLIGVVCAIVGRALSVAGEDSGFTSETIEGYTYQRGGAAANGAFGMMAGERAVLDSYRLPRKPIRML